MSDAPIRFQGWISCRRDGDGPLGLMLTGRTQDRPDEIAHLAFAAPAPPNIPDALEDATVERLSAREYRISSGGRYWTVQGTAHLHREIATVFYRAIPARHVPWTKRLFWRVLLALAARPAGRWLLKARRASS